MHVSVTPGTTAGFLRITFTGGTPSNGDFVAFYIPANQSFSVTQTFGGVPDVDDLVKVEITGGDAGTGAGIVSALVRTGAVDPFSGDSETDNYCLTGTSASTGDAGVASAHAIINY